PAGDNRLATDSRLDSENRSRLYLWQRHRHAGRDPQLLEQQRLLCRRRKRHSKRKPPRTKPMGHSLGRMKKIKQTLRSLLATAWSEQYVRLPVEGLEVGAPYALSINGKPTPFQYTGRAGEVLVR